MIIIKLNKFNIINFYPNAVLVTISIHRFIFIFKVIWSTFSLLYYSLSQNPYIILLPIHFRITISPDNTTSKYRYT